MSGEGWGYLVQGGLGLAQHRGAWAEVRQRGGHLLDQQVRAWLGLGLGLGLELVSGLGLGLGLGLG